MSFLGTKLIACMHPVVFVLTAEWSSWIISIRRQTHENWLFLVVLSLGKLWLRKPQDQGSTGRGFQLQDGSGSGIGKKISGRTGYGSGTGICIVYSINRVLSGSENIDRVFFGYLSTSYLSHGTWWFLMGPMVLMVVYGKNLFDIQTHVCFPFSHWHLFCFGDPVYLRLLVVLLLS